jgi:hypothetical protein
MADPAMHKQQSITKWLDERGLDVARLVALSGLDERVVASIVAGRYTTSPQQRQQIATALNVSVDQIQWGRAVEVDHMYGHGPQFGRSP